MKFPKQNELFYTISIAILLLAATLIRFDRFWEIPLTYDELSALSRLRFNSLAELIQFGIKPDGHPAGVQLFLFYWTHLVGLTPWMIKLPFLILSVASVYLIYKIGRLWFNPSVALLSSAITVAMQAFVLYGQLARPYSPGLFFSLLTVYFWSLYFFKRRSIRFLFAYAISAFLAASMHHFALLFIAIVGFSGFLFLRKNNFKSYFVANVGIFVLYLPELPVFFSQLKIGGIGGPGNWLKQPTSDFLIDYLSWVFHYSFWFIGATVASILLAFFLSQNEKEIGKLLLKKRMFLALWFLLPIGVGYFYSIWFNPVLQFSVLLFSLPFLLILLFSFSSNLRPIYLGIILSLIVVSSFYSLIFERHHHRVLYKQKFQELLEIAIEQEESTFILTDIQAYFLEYHFQLFKQNIPFYSFYNQTFNPNQLDRLLQTIHQESIVVSGLPSYQKQLVSKYFPFERKTSKGYTYEITVFSKKEHNQPPPPKNFPIAVFPSDESDSKWKFSSANLQFDSASNSEVLKVNRKALYPLTFTDSLKHLGTAKTGVLEAEFDIKAVDSLQVVVVMELKNENHLVIWRGLNTTNYPFIPKQWNRVFFSMDIQELSLKPSEQEKMVFSAYLWNKYEAEFEVIQSQLHTIDGNKLRYALFHKIE